MNENKYFYDLFGWLTETPEDVTRFTFIAPGENLPIGKSWRFVGGDVVWMDFFKRNQIDSAEEAVPSKPKTMKLSKKAFLARWTDKEAIAIDLASIDNPSATQQVREDSAFLRRQRDLQAQAEYVDLCDEKTRSGVTGMMAMLEGIGVIDSAARRTDEFLNTPLSDGEKFDG